MPTQSIDLSAVTDATFSGSAVDAINLNGTEIWAGSQPFSLYSRIPADNTAEKCQTFHVNFGYVGGYDNYKFPVWSYDIANNYNVVNAGKYVNGMTTMRLNSSSNKVVITTDALDISAMTYKSATTVSTGTSSSYKEITATVSPPVFTVVTPQGTYNADVIITYEDKLPATYWWPAYASYTGGVVTYLTAYDNLPANATDVITVKAVTRKIGNSQYVVPENQILCNDTLANTADFQTTSNVSLNNFVIAEQQLAGSETFNFFTGDIWGITDVVTCYPATAYDPAYCDPRKYTLKGWYQGKYYDVSHSVSGGSAGAYTTVNSYINAFSPAYSQLVNSNLGPMWNQYDGSNTLISSNLYARASSSVGDYTNGFSQGV